MHKQLLLFYRRFCNSKMHILLFESVRKIINVKDNHVTICSLIRKKNINPKIIPLQRPFKSLPFETICKCYENALRDTFSIMMTLTDIIILHFYRAFFDQTENLKQNVILNLNFFPISSTIKNN